MNSSYTIIVVDRAATRILHIPIGGSDGYTYPLTAPQLEKVDGARNR